MQVPIGSEKGFRGVVDLVSGKAWEFEARRHRQGQGDPGPDEVAGDVETWRTRLVEAVAESDEALMERFFEEGSLSEAELLAGLRKAVRMPPASSRS